MAGDQGDLLEKYWLKCSRVTLNEISSRVSQYRMEIYMRDFKRFYGNYEAALELNRKLLVRIRFATSQTVVSATIAETLMSADLTSLTVLRIQLSLL